MSVAPQKPQASSADVAAQPSAKTEIVETLKLEDCPVCPSYVDMVAVRGDELERKLIENIRQLSCDNTPYLTKAFKEEDPAIVKRYLRAVVAIQKAMLELIKDLDCHRHGPAQKIFVHYGPPQPKSFGGDTEESKLWVSDRMIEGLFLGGVENLEDFIAICRRNAKLLGQSPPHELYPRGFGLPGPDRRDWEMKFESLAIYLTLQSTRLGSAMRSRRNKYCHQVNVIYSEAIPAIKKVVIKNKIATTEKHSSKFVIAKNVKKASCR